MHTPSTEIKAALTARLSRIEGQARGVRKMVDDDRDCHEVLQQLNAMNAAIRNATQLFMRAYARECLLDQNAEQNREALVDDLLDLMARVR